MGNHRRQEVSWNEHRHWWVVTWWDNGAYTRKNGGSIVHVTVLDAGNILILDYPPPHAVMFGDKEKTAGPANGHMFHLLQSNIWARMPIKFPQPPNVDMFFAEWPFDLTGQA